MKHKSILSVGVFLFAALVLLDESLLAGEGPELSKDDKKADDRAQATIDRGGRSFVSIPSATRLGGAIRSSCIRRSPVHETAASVRG